MKENIDELALTILYENRKKLCERMERINKMIIDYENGKMGDTGQKNKDLKAIVNVKYHSIDSEDDGQEIINIFMLVGRPLMTSEIKNYLDNNLGISFPQTGVALKKLKDKKILAHLMLNNTKKLSYWVMNEWVDWKRGELKRQYKKFGVTKNYSIKLIEFF